MSTVKSNRHQLGLSSTATQNFTLTAEAADGTMKLARGNAGATTQNILTVDSTGLVAAPQGSYGGLRLQTAVATTSGTSVDFTSIPSWVKRITFDLSGVSTNGTSVVILQIGDSGGVENTGYVGACAQIANATSPTTSAFSSGFIIDGATNATATRYGALTLTLLDAASNLWTCSGNVGRGDSAVVSAIAGTKSLSATLDRIRLTSAGGTDTFDAGSVNILYEG